MKFAASVLVAIAGFVVLLGAASPAEAAAAELTVDTTGNGPGFVTSIPAGIDCGQNVAGHTDCSEEFDQDQEITLTVGGWARFLGYSGACNTTALQCNVTMDEAKTVTANFGKYDAAVSVVTNDSYLGSTINAQGVIEGGLWPKQGTVQFDLYGPDDADCTGPSIFSPQATVSGTQQVYGSGDFTPTQPGVYRWRATYSGDGNNNSTSSACNSSNSVATVNKAATFVGNDASDTTIGGSVSDTATLSGGQSPGGSITMSLYAAGDTNCVGQPLQMTNVNVDGNGPYGSGNFVPTQTGTYRWISEYSGDANNSPYVTPCSSASARSIVSAQAVALAIQAENATVGSAIVSTATIAQGQSPTGTITFRAYPPGDDDCSGAPEAVRDAVVNGNGEYESLPSWSVLQAGDYRWTAAYSGDSINAPAATLCGAAGSISTIAKAEPGLTSPAATDITIGASLPAQTTLSAAFAAGGNIVFAAYGPGDTTCSLAPAHTSDPLPVSGNGTYGIDDFTPAVPGAYRWIASYSGDGNNEARSTSCGPPSNVAQDSPALSIGATDATIGEPVSATASLTGGFDPTGTITFNAYGPDDQTCSGTPAFTSSVTVDGNDTYDSGPFAATGAGTYRWTAAYSGDADNESDASLCADPDAISTIAQAIPAVTVSATEAVIGSPITATTDLTDGVEPGGTVTFSAYGPDGSGCSATPAFTATIEVDGNGEYSSGPFTPTAVGSYRWTADYSGDVDNEAVTSSCGEPGATSAVAKAVPLVAGAVSGDIRLGGTVNASITFTGGYQMTGQASFTLFGPDDPTCSGEPAFTGTVSVNGNGTVTSPDFKPVKTGTYRWTASYSGDANNVGFTGTCVAGLNVKVAPKTCPAVKLTAIPYKPAKIVRGRMAHGVRARIIVTRPSTLAISAKARFELRGKTRTVDFGKRSLRNGGTRNLRLVLPRKWRAKLPLHAEVKLTLKVTATPRDPKGCTSPPTTVHRFKTRVFWVLTAKQR